MQPVKLSVRCYDLPNVWPPPAAFSRDVAWAPPKGTVRVYKSNLQFTIVVKTEQAYAYVIGWLDAHPCVKYYGVEGQDPMKGFPD